MTNISNWIKTGNSRFQSSRTNKDKLWTSSLVLRLEKDISLKFGTRTKKSGNPCAWRTKVVKFTVEIWKTLTGLSKWKYVLIKIGFRTWRVLSTLSSFIIFLTSLITFMLTYFSCRSWTCCDLIMALMQWFSTFLNSRHTNFEYKFGDTSKCKMLQYHWS